MNKKEEEFLRRIQITFRIEAEEHISAFSRGLIELEKAGTGDKVPEIIETLFREIHSLKGAARSVDQKNIESLCQPLESVFSLLKTHKLSLSPDLLNILFKSSEFLKSFLAKNAKDISRSDHQNLKELIIRLNANSSGNLSIKTEQKLIGSKVLEEAHETISTKEIAHIPSRDTVSTETVRIRISKLDPLLLQAEEMLQSKIAVDQRLKELRILSSHLNEWKAEMQKLRSRKAEVSSIHWNDCYDSGEMYMNKAEDMLYEITHSMQSDQHFYDRLVNLHLDSMKQVLMLPVSSTVEAFPSMVREISKEQNKEVDFVLEGTELEIDRRILEEIKDPIIHLIRNSIDHGIGKPHERTLQNKPPFGKIKLSFAAKENGQFEISLSDDGRGIDNDNLLKAALKSGCLSSIEATQLTHEQILNLIYKSGVSTASIITDLSGRGLGLSIVNEKVSKLNGTISVETKAGAGTQFRIRLPMALATFRGIMVRVNEFMFILPTMNVEKVLSAETNNINTVENHETIRIGNRLISVVDTSEVLGLHPDYRSAKDQEKDGKILLIILRSAEQCIAFKIDEVVEEQQVLVKGLGKLLKRVKNISGATILGNGTVVPVLNVSDLIKTAMKVNMGSRQNGGDESVVLNASKILIAEDSITSRTLIKNILESAGYEVTTSVDGADAYAKAKIGNFDIIVSDVDMPKMNGFELTYKIKNDKKLSEVPVVLVTALESRDDRERGIEVGADAYIIKSSFDQSNLLEIIKKLI
jgi:two-component system, chemotaxis family, sensor kinase CheA